MSTFTPGPWKIVDAMGGDREVLYRNIDPDLPEGEYRGSVCSVSDAENIDGITKAEALANATAIRALPDLIEAMRDAIALADRNAEMLDCKPVRSAECQASYDRCVAALRKATGEQA